MALFGFIRLFADYIVLGTLFMKSITEKTLKDLEFNQVLHLIVPFSISELGAEHILNIKPIADDALKIKSLRKVDEYLTSFINENTIPNHTFFDTTQAIYLLGIENTYIEPKELLGLAENIKTIQGLQKFFKKFKEIYPILFQHNQEITLPREVPDLITGKITKYATVSDKASALLKNIRKEINTINSQIASSFNRALQSCQKLDYLDPIKESIIEGKRVLAVQAMYRKKVNGALLGTSKTGSIFFIEPQATLQYSRELAHLQLEEKEEIIRILKELTDLLRPYQELFVLHRDYLTEMDVIASKAKYAQHIQAVLPTISSEKKIDLKNAYHPLLWHQNKEKGLPVIPQNILLNKQQQIIVVSGPNAGGKSITLKTIGLLQVMLQSGLLIPVHEKSELSFFNTILTDIGDNQSIENQLSTYSYRLKNMRYFLRKCDANTLFLIDEFGTGTDPELGGALAEVFLEEFYHKKAFGVITTHYANLKALADELEFATNANMQFDKRNLQPLFELVTGQAGSSFTFEVAQQNGIPYSLINRAKKRVSKSKIRLDKTISKLQTERNKLMKQSYHLQKEEGKATEKAHLLENKHTKIQDKLEQFQLLYDTNQKMLQYGRTINELTNVYFQTNNKKKLTQDFLKWVQAEKIKYTKKNPPKKSSKKEKQVNKVKVQKKKQALQKIEKEVLQAVEKIRKKEQEEDKKRALHKINYQFKVGDIVRLKDGRANGVIDQIEKNKIRINYGLFTTLTNLEKIELVRSLKK